MLLLFGRKDMKMKIGKSGKRMVLAIAVAIVAIVVVTLIVYFVYPSYHNFAFHMYWDHMIYKAQQRRVLLLCETVHQALLKAGREILSEVPVKKTIQRTKNETPGIIGNFPIPKGVRIPQAILDLRPHAVVIDYDGYLIIEMHGGMDHFGVRIYPEEFKAPYPGFKYINRKLTEGLWYYDIGYDGNPEFDERIEELLQKRK